VRFVAELFLKAKLPAMLAAHRAAAGREVGGAMTLRYEALSAGGASRDLAVKELPGFLGVRGVVAGGVVARARAPDRPPSGAKAYGQPSPHLQRASASGGLVHVAGQGGGGGNDGGWGFGGRRRRRRRLLLSRGGNIVPMLGASHRSRRHAGKEEGSFGEELWAAAAAGGHSSGGHGSSHGSGHSSGLGVVSAWGGSEADHMRGALGGFYGVVSAKSRHEEHRHGRKPGTTAAAATTTKTSFAAATAAASATASSAGFVGADPSSPQWLSQAAAAEAQARGSSLAAELRPESRGGGGSGGDGRRGGGRGSAGGSGGEVAAKQLAEASLVEKRSMPGSHKHARRFWRGKGGGARAQLVYTSSTRTCMELQHRPHPGCRPSLTGSLPLPAPPHGYNLRIRARTGPGRVRPALARLPASR